MALINKEFIETLSDDGNTGVQLIRIKFLGIPLYSSIFQTTNFQYMNQFIPSFQEKDNVTESELYTKTHIGFDITNNKKEDKNNGKNTKKSKKRKKQSKSKE